MRKGFIGVAGGEPYQAGTTGVSAGEGWQGAREQSWATGVSGQPRARVGEELAVRPGLRPPFGQGEGRRRFRTGQVAM